MRSELILVTPITHVTAVIFALYDKPYLKGNSLLRCDNTKFKAPKTFLVCQRGMPSDHVCNDFILKMISFRSELMSKHRACFGIALVTEAARDYQCSPLSMTRKRQHFRSCVNPLWNQCLDSSSTNILHVARGGLS